VGIRSCQAFSSRRVFFPGLSVMATSSSIESQIAQSLTSKTLNIKVNHANTWMSPICRRFAPTCMSRHLSCWSDVVQSCPLDLRTFCTLKARRFAHMISVHTSRHQKMLILQLTGLPYRTSLAL
jgi:hypothetical protein